MNNVEKEYPDSIMLARQAKHDLNLAKQRYYMAMAESLPEGTEISYCANNDKIYDGIIVESPSPSGYLKVKSCHTGKTYSISTYRIEGLSGI